jgi:hypothetical protein
MMHITRFVLLAGLLGASISVDGADPRSLAELAAEADLVALAQLRDTDYRRQRNIPVSGAAYLRVLIPYKGVKAGEIIEVFEKGLRDTECYFPNPTVFEEGRRYLLFLRRDPAEPERFRGLPEGCALDVLVDTDNGYALRYPLNGIAVSDLLAGLAREMAFADPYSIVEDRDLPPSERSELQSGGFIAPHSDDRQSAETQSGSLAPPPEYRGPRWRYTHGIPLESFRPLLELEP